MCCAEMAASVLHVWQHVCCASFAARVLHLSGSFCVICNVGAVHRLYAAFIWQLVQFNYMVFTLQTVF